MTCPAHKQFQSLDDLCERLQSTDLIPSQEPLLDRIDERFGLLAGIGITSISDLQVRLKNRAAADALADESGVDVDYLMLLRRAIGGFVPKPRPLRSFDWVDPHVIAALDHAGVKNSQQLRSAAAGGVEQLAEATGVSAAELATLVTVADLVRVQWVSPSFGRALLAAGFPDPASVAAADPDELVEALSAVNEGGTFYNGTVGKRDVSRLIDAAAYVA